MTVITGSQIPIFRLITLAKGIEVEAKGIRMTRGRSCLAITKSEFGWKGNRETILYNLYQEIERLKGEA